jgi:DNA-binding response OmpR family regulator
MAAKLLFVEDDPDLRLTATYALRREGFEVVVAADGQQALDAWRTQRPDLVLLDVGLPGLSGFEVARRMRQEQPTPLIFLTAHGEEAQVARGFELGADDYIAKPVSLRVLPLRVRGVLARRREMAAERGLIGARPDATLGTAALKLDPERRAAVRAGVRAQLTATEYRLLEILVANAGWVVPYPRLVAYVWRDGERGTPDALRPHVSHLRAKLGLTNGAADAIESVVGVGYRLRT